MLGVYEVWEWGSEIVDISGKIIPKFIGKVWKSAARVPRGGQNRSKGALGEAKIGPRGAPRRFRKSGREKNALEQETAKQMIPKSHPKSQGLCYF